MDGYLGLRVSDVTALDKNGESFRMSFPLHLLLVYFWEEVGLWSTVSILLVLLYKIEISSITDWCFFYDVLSGKFSWFVGKVLPSLLVGLEREAPAQFRVQQ